MRGHENISSGLNFSLHVVILFFFSFFLWLHVFTPSTCYTIHAGRTQICGIKPMNQFCQMICFVLDIDRAPDDSKETPG